MRITYDEEVDALYIRFLDTTVTTQHVAEGIAVDYATDGRVAAIEVLDARKRFGGTDVLRHVVLEDVALSTVSAATHGVADSPEEYRSPVYLDPDVNDFLSKIAEQKHVDVQNLVNDWLRAGMKLIQSAE